MENEKRLIDASVIIRDLTAMKSMFDAIALDGMIKALKEAPTVDAVEVVRCKDCKHYYYSAYAMRCVCDFDNKEWDKDDFCSYGERRTDGKE